MRFMLSRLALFVYAVAMLANVVHAQAPDAEPMGGQEIMTRSYETRRVEDETAVLNFLITKPDGKEERVTYTMLWKNNHGKNGFDQKVIFVTDFPPSRQGVAYMGYLRQPGSGARDEEWIYLPELAMVRRIAHRNRDQSDDDEFAHSVLKREHLDPRPPQLDEHHLLKQETIGEQTFYKVESRLKPADSQDAPFDKYHTWVERDSFRPKRVHFFAGDNNEPALDMVIDWTQVNNQWVWKSVRAEDPRSGAKTVMDISNIRVNTGLKDNVFSKRTLSRGVNRLMR